MEQKLDELKSGFLAKQELLENARITLKKEFVGIDNIIDEIITNVSPWFLLAEFQDRPTVINLWGLTGVGKTSLIVRLVELIDYSSLYYRFDMASTNNKSEFSSSIDDLCDNPDNTPIIIALDEFQHARTLVGLNREEKLNDSNRLVWELLDTGKLTVSIWMRDIWDFIDQTKKLDSLLKAGVRVENGVVVEKVELHKQEISYRKSSDKDEKYFYPTRDYNDILTFAGEELGLRLENDVQEIMLKLSGSETIDFLYKVMKIAQKPKKKSFAQSLIFVMANIDEAYTMSSDYSPDIDADSFYEMSLKITVPIIKNALRSRFRDEQIARLGNIHVIYPSLSRNAYNMIITMELEKITKNFRNKLHLLFEFDSSVHTEIYTEGVSPAQGARQIFTTIHQLIKSKLTIFITDILTLNLNVDNLKLSIKDGMLICEYFNDGKVIHSKTDKITSKINKLRKNRKDDRQAIVAVHESGHAILHTILLHQVPELVMSVTADVMRDGFVSVKPETKYHSRKTILNYVAMLLGGLVAEEIIFGKENLTSGSSSDIETATNYVLELYKSNGFGENPVRFTTSDSNNENAIHNVTDIELEVQLVIAKGKLLAERTLRNEKKLLLQLSQFLSNNTSIKQEELRTMINTYSKENTMEIENKNFYRNILNRQIVELPEPIKIFELQCTPEVLNKSTDIILD